MLCRFNPANQCHMWKSSRGAKDIKLLQTSSLEGPLACVALRRCLRCHIRASHVVASGIMCTGRLCWRRRDGVEGGGGGGEGGEGEQKRAMSYFRARDRPWVDYGGEKISKSYHLTSDVVRSYCNSLKIDC